MWCVLSFVIGFLSGALTSAILAVSYGTDTEKGRRLRRGRKEKVW